MGLTLSLITPRKIVPNEMDKLATVLKNRLNEGKEEVKGPIHIKDILAMVLKNQRKLAKEQLKLAETQHYLTKFLYYSLEVMRRIIRSINSKREERSVIKHSTEIDAHIINYLKSKVREI